MSEVTGCELIVWLIAGGEGGTDLAVHLDHAGGQVSGGDGKTTAATTQVLGGGGGGRGGKSVAEDDRGIDRKSKAKYDRMEGRPSMKIAQSTPSPPLPPPLTFSSILVKMVCIASLPG